MSRFLFSLLIALAIMSVVTAGKPEKRCGKNEVWSECNGKCEPSCDQPNPVCTKQCSSGCICKEGLLRDQCGNCVEPCDCKGL